MMTSLARVGIRYEQDVVNARQQARLIAEQLGFDRQDQTRISTAVSEIARNAHQYGQGGEVEFLLEATAHQPRFTIVVRDHGPGIAELNTILEGRYTSRTGMGMGIVGSRRLLDYFHIDTSPGQGTTVTLGKSLPLNTPAGTPAVLRRIADALAANHSASPMEEIRAQNQELVVELTERKRLEAEIRDAREYAENIVETVREPLLVLNSELKILTANHNFYDAFKVSSAETIGHFIYDLGNRQWDIPKLRILLDEILPQKTVLNGYEVEHDFPAIGRKTILLNARQIFREDIGSHIILLAMEDITERKLAEKALQERNKELGCLYSIISLSNDPGISFDELLKRAVMRIPPAWQFPDRTEARIEIGEKSFQTARFEETPWMLAQEIIAQDNKVGKVTVCCLEELPFLPDELTLLNAIADNLGLIVMRELARETISQLAVTDELTGLNNRRFFNESLAKAVSAARRHRQPLSLISIDIDHFKKVNDTFGHTMGDLVLKEFSQLLKRMVRVEDIVCRLGGEEFIVLLPNTACEGAVALADRMRSSFEQHPRTTTPVVTASFGVARLQEAEDENSLMRRVDDALYQAKHEGRNRVVAACNAALA